MLSPIDTLIDVCENSPVWGGKTKFSISTNLVYPLTDKKIDFFQKYMDDMGSSYDFLRFENKMQQELWEQNSRILNELVPMTLFVTLDRKMVNTDPRIVIEYAISLGYRYILFERITNDGHAKSNPDIKPNNHEQDFWLHRMYEETVKNEYYKQIGNVFLNELAEAWIYGVHTGNRCRNCEQNLLTINADGTIAGCPNTAPVDNWGHIDQAVEELFQSRGRKEAILCETNRDPRCYECDAFDVCNGDCYKLEWQGNKCQAPQMIWQSLKQDDSHIKKLLM